MQALILIAITFGLMYMLIIRPQQSRVRAHQAVVTKMKVGDNVMTTAGLFGKIVEMDTSTVHLEVANGVVMKFARGAVGDVVQPSATDEVDAAADHDDTDAAAAGDAAAPSGARVIQPRRGLSRRRSDAGNSSSEATDA